MNDTPEEKEFAGFSIPEKNYFPMPNEWINICADIDNLSELKVIQYVLRHTWGYQEYGGYKTISVDEFMKGRRRQDRTRMDNGTGLSEPSVKDGLKRAIKHGYLVCITDDKDKGRVKKSYGLKMHEASEQDKKLTGQETYPVTNLSPEDKELTPRGQKSYPRTEKDTRERHLEKKSVSEPPTESSPPREATHTSFSNSSSPILSHLPQGNDEKPIPPNPDKAQVNPSKKPGWERLLDYWDSKYGPGARPDRVVEKAKDMMERMNPTPEKIDKVCAELKARHKPITFETMYNNWHLLKEVEEREQAKTNPGNIGVSGRRRFELPPEYLAMMTEGGK